jgi:hypothetical protein
LNVAAQDTAWGQLDLAAALDLGELLGSNPSVINKGELDSAILDIGGVVRTVEQQGSGHKQFRAQVFERVPHFTPAFFLCVQCRQPGALVVARNDPVVSV